MTLQHTAERITAQHLLAQAQVYAPPAPANAPVSRFYCFVNAFPNAPHQIATVSGNLLQRDDGRLMDGTPTNHPGIQIRVRASTQLQAETKVWSLWNFLNTVKRVTVTVESVNYILLNCSVSSQPMYIGFGEDDQRPSFVFDAYVSMKGS